MSITYPTTLDTFSNPSPSDSTENATLGLDHDQQHSNANDAIEALEAKVGVTSSAVTTSHDYKLSNITGSEKATGSLYDLTFVGRDGTTITFPAANARMSAIVSKILDESVTNSSTLISDFELNWPAISGTTYFFRFDLLVTNTNDAGPDWKAAVLAPAASTGQVTQFGTEPAGSAFPQTTTTNVTTPGTLVNTVIVADGNVPFQVSLQGWVTAGANGTIALQWAQNTATPGVALTVLKGSRVTYST